MNPSEVDTLTLLSATVGLAVAGVPVPFSWQLELARRGLTPSDVTESLLFFYAVQRSQDFIAEVDFDDVDRENVKEVGGVIYALPVNNEGANGEEDNRHS